MDYNEDEWNWENDQNNIVEVPKISILSKIKWRLLYKECYKRFGYDVSKINLLLNNKEISRFYKNNKNTIYNLLEKYEQTVSSDSSELFNVILQSAQRGTSDKIISKIENYIAEINNIKADKYFSIDGDNIVKTEQNEFLDFLKKNIIELKIDDLEKDDDQNIIQLHKGKIEFAKKLQEAYGEDASRVITQYNSWIDKLNSKNITNNPFFKTLIERTKIFCKSKVQEGANIENIEKNVNTVCKIYPWCNINYGENVRNLITENIEDIEFFLNDNYLFFNEEFLESNDALNYIIHEKKNPIEKAINIRKRFFDARIKDERQNGNLEKVKELVCKKYFGVSESDLPKQIEGLSEKTRKAINCIRKINNSNTYETIDKIMNLLDTSEFQQFDNTVVNEISNEFKNEFRRQIFNVNDRQPTSYVEYRGKQIPIITLKGEDFRGVIHAASDPNKIEKFEGASGHLCTSEQSDRAYNFFNRGLKVGFSNLTNEELYENIGTSGMGTGRGTSKKEKMYLETLSFKIDAVEETSETGNINEIDIKPKKPDYIFSFNKKQDVQELEIASRLGIPIVTMDMDSYQLKYESLYRRKTKLF